ncbi:transposase [Streptomyces sp. NPDC091259]|uniref:transposase n=1 Tax=Streptomyces sp. NPDC091259 TaxID=3365976 RepID=UPI00382636B1
MNEPGDLDDQEWDAIRALLPRYVPSGPDYRTIVNGILWQQTGGRRWHDLPTRYGPWHRCAEYACGTPTAPGPAS